MHPRRPSVVALVAPLLTTACVVGPNFHQPPPPQVSSYIPEPPRKTAAGIKGVTLVQELGQPSLTIKIDRARIARYGINVDVINALIQTAIGGDVATQVDRLEV